MALTSLKTSGAEARHVESLSAEVAVVATAILAAAQEHGSGHLKGLTPEERDSLKAMSTRLAQMSVVLDDLAEELDKVEHRKAGS